MQGTMLVNWLLVLVVVLATLHTCKGIRNLGRPNKARPNKNIRNEEILGEASPVVATEWSHDDDDEWFEDYPQYCAGHKQSPIDIVPSHTSFQMYWRSLQFVNYDLLPKKQIVYNDGHRVYVKFKDIETLERSKIPSIVGGGLPGIYNFVYYEVHFGCRDDEGSDHTIDEKEYPMELHIVHIKKRYYPDMDEALKYSDGVATLSILFDISHTDNPMLAPLADALHYVTESNSEKSIKNMYPLSSLLPEHPNHFYRYQGSLTTPPCNEAVIWTVFQNSLEISDAQLEDFRDMKDNEGNHYDDNYRRRQKLNGRTVFRSSVFHP